MTRHLLDANVLIALAVAEHEHHDAASEWYLHHPQIAVCPITEGAFVRFLVRIGVTGRTAQTLVAAIARLPDSEFWPDTLSYAETPLDHVIGHRQVSDAYLAALTRARPGARVATFDRGMVAVASDIAVLVPTT